MLYESHAGTAYAVSRDGVQWNDMGLLAGRMDIASERHGHVTPFLLPNANGAGALLYYGAAAQASWNQNMICVRQLTIAQWFSLKNAKLP